MCRLKQDLLPLCRHSFCLFLETGVPQIFHHPSVCSFVLHFRTILSTRLSVLFTSSFPLLFLATQTPNIQSFTRSPFRRHFLIKKRFVSSYTSEHGVPLYVFSYRPTSLHFRFPWLLLFRSFTFIDLGRLVPVHVVFYSGPSVDPWSDPTGIRDCD